MRAETFVELRCLVAACRAKKVADYKIEIILFDAGLEEEDVLDLMYRWQE